MRSFKFSDLILRRFIESGEISRLDAFPHFRYDCYKPT